MPVELQVVFPLQDVVDDARAAANAGLALSPRIPREPDSRSPVVEIGVVRAARGTRIAWKQHPDRGIRKHGGLLPESQRERAALRVELGLAVLVPYAQ